MTPTSHIGVTDHAVRRYIERVKPALEHDAADTELRALIRAGEFTHELEWVGRCNERWVTENPHEAAQMAFVILSDGIAAGLKRTGENRYTATTVLTRAGKSPESAAARRKMKRDKRFKRRMARVHGRTQDNQFYRKAYGKHYAE